MKILVTGANGFIGQALCPYLRARGFDVVSVVRRPTGLLDTVIAGDDDEWMEALKGCSAVIHLAGRAHVMNDRSTEPLQVFRANNVAPTLRLAQQAAAAGVRRFVFMSTIKVNGESTGPGRSFTEVSPPAPSDPYAVSKWEAEQGLHEFAERSGLEVVVIRPPLVYGPGVKGNFASLIKWVTLGVPLPLGAVHNRRSLIGIGNLIAFATLCADLVASPHARGETFLVSDGDAISTTDLLRKVAVAFGCQSRLLPIPAWLMHGCARVTGQSAKIDRLLESLLIDDTKARHLLGWTPSVTIDDQLRLMATAQRINLSL